MVDDIGRGIASLRHDKAPKLVKSGLSAGKSTCLNGFDVIRDKRSLLDGNEAFYAILLSSLGFALPFIAGRHSNPLKIGGSSSLEHLMPVLLLYRLSFLENLVKGNLASQEALI